LRKNTKLYRMEGLKSNFRNCFCITVFMQLKTVLSFIFLWPANFLFAQNVTISNVDSISVLYNQHNILRFSQMLDTDNLSSLQILFCQVESPQIDDAESYYLKVDSNSSCHKYMFTSNTIKEDTVDTRFDPAQLKVFALPDTEYVTQFCEDYTNAPGRDPFVYFVIKQCDRYHKLYISGGLLNVLSQLQGLDDVQNALLLLQAQFKIHYHKILDY
jgi:hypothetical protein